MTKKEVNQLIDNNATVAGKATAITSAFLPITYSGTISFGYDPLNPNRSLALSGNVSSFTMTGTNDGDGGLLAITKTAGTETISLPGSVVGSLKSLASGLDFVSWINKGGTLYWFVEGSASVSIAAYLQNLSGYVGDGSKSLRDNLTWVTAGEAPPTFDLTGLKAYYKFNETSGSPANSAPSGSPATGTVVGTLSQTGVGHEGNCYTFTDGHVDIGAVSTSNTFTYASWINVTDISGYPAIITSYGDGYLGAMLFIHENGSVQLERAVQAQVGTTAAGAVTINTWYHIAVTYNNSNSAWVIYINGTSAASGTAASTFNFGNFRIGRSITTERPFKGRIDNVVVADRVYSSSEIVQLCATGLGI